jgi:hypothetical protein
MHEDKIWALEVQYVDDELKMITGGSDSFVKLWRDNTEQEEINQKEEKLTRLD